MDVVFVYLMVVVCTTSTSASGPLVIQNLVPFKT